LCHESGPHVIERDEEERRERRINEGEIRLWWRRRSGE
jgi:hypothetical protein